MDKRTAFRANLEELINQFSIENGSNTPDFLLADYLIACLDAYEKAKNESVRLYPSLQIISPK